MICLKRAVIRDPEAPIGQMARLWLHCGCGRLVEIDAGAYVRQEPREYACDCGCRYDGNGYVISSDA